MHQKIQMVVIQFSDKKCMLFNNNPKTTWTSAIKHYFLENGVKSEILKIWTSYSPYIEPKAPLRQCDMLDIQFYLDEEGYGRTLGKLIFKRASKSVTDKVNAIVESVINGTADPRRV